MSPGERYDTTKRHAMGKVTRKRAMNGLVGACLMASILLFGSYTVSGAESFHPDWRVGDSWSVKVVQRLPAVADGWSAPVVWVYRVDGMETRADEPVYVVDVTSVSGNNGPGARLWFRCADRSLAAVEVRRSNEQVVAKLAFDTAVPVSTERSSIPFDAPLFPVELPSSGQYQAKRSIGGGFVKTVTLRQDAKRYSGEVELCPSVAGDNLIEIRCTRNGEVSFVQYWDETAPWPICGENGHLRYWLVRE